MGAINTEDAARRLARVILSDIDLYMQERPKLGESREAQIEEGRRLFASRVAPELVPVFAMVLADRAAGRVKAPAAAAAPSIPASAAPATVGPVHSAPASNSAIEDEPTDPSIFVPSFEDQPPRAPALTARPAPPTPAARLVAPAPPPPPLVARARPEILTPVPAAPVPTARVSIPRLLATVMAAIVAVFRRFFR